MKTKQLFSILKRGALSLCLIALVSACNDEKEMVFEEAPTMGDPKSSSPNASRCYSISLFIEDGDDETSDYANIRFQFFNSGSVIARSATQEFQGSWALGFDDGVQKLFLNFNGTIPLLNELTDDWNVVSLAQNNPQFIEDDNNPDILQFVPSECAPEPVAPSAELEAFNANLLGGSWTVASFIDDGINETNDFNNTTFTFNANGTVVAQRFNQQRTGQWTTSESNGVFELEFQFQGPPTLNELNEDWDVVSFSDNEIQLQDIDPNDADFVTFTRN